MTTLCWKNAGDRERHCRRHTRERKAGEWRRRSRPTESRRFQQRALESRLAAFSVLTLLFLRFLPSCVRQLTRSVRRPAARPGHRRSLKPGIQHPTLHRCAAILVWKLASHLKGSPDEAKTEFGENHSDGSTLTVSRCLRKSRLGGTRRTQLHLEG